MKGSGPVAEADLIRFHAGALTGAARAAVAEMVAADPAAQALLDEWQRQDRALRQAFGPAGAEPMPDPLRALLGAARESDRANHRAGPRLRMAWPLRFAAAIALLAIGAAGGYRLAPAGPSGVPPARFAEAALDAHATYVPEVLHPVEVGAAEAGHLRAWLSKRLGRPIRVPDFAPAGFRLIGGRLVPSGTGPAALFMYEDDLGGRVTVYVVSGASGDETSMRFAEKGATQSFYWIDAGLSCAVTGEIPREALRAIALAAYDQLI